MGSRDALTGFTIGVTAARRAPELIALLQRRGALTLHAPAIRIVHLVDDATLRGMTECLIAEPADVLVVTTGFGFRSWIDAADAWGLAEALFAALGAMTIIARGPKALGAIRQAGLRESWSPHSGSSREVAQRLISQGVAGRRVAVQLDGAGSQSEPNADLCHALRGAGALVVALPVYRWEPPVDIAPMNRLIAAVLAGRIDAVSFTSAPAVASMVQRAQACNALPEFITELRRVSVACVGPATAAPLIRLGVPTITPHRYRLGALAGLLIDELPRRASRLHVGGHTVVILGAGVKVDDRWHPVSPVGVAILRELIDADGCVVSAASLRTALQRQGLIAPNAQQHDRHTIDVAVARLRGALKTPDLIHTSTKRGYRLATDDLPRR